MCVRYKFPVFNKLNNQFSYNLSWQSNSCYYKKRFQLLQNYWNKCQENAAIIETIASEEDEQTLSFFQDKLLDQAEAIYLQAYDFFQERIETFNTA